MAFVEQSPGGASKGDAQQQLCAFYLSHSRLDDALAAAEACLALRRAPLGKRSDEELADALSNYGLLLYRKQDLAPARVALQEAVDLRSRRHGPDSLQASEPREASPGPPYLCNRKENRQQTNSICCLYSRDSILRAETVRNCQKGWFVFLVSR